MNANAASAISPTVDAPAVRARRYLSTVGSVAMDDGGTTTRVSSEGYARGVRINGAATVQRASIVRREIVSVCYVD